MGFFPLRQIPGVAWPGIPDGALAQLWAMYLELERTQWLGPEELVAGQLAQVRSLLAHCKEHVPYYQDVLRQAHIEPADIQTLDDFRRVPILTRQVYQQQFPRFQARSLPPGSCKTHEDHTSGSSGVPIEIWQTNLVNLWWCVLCLRDYRWTNIDPRGALASIRVFASLKTARPEDLEGKTYPCWSNIFDPLLKTGPLHCLDVLQDPRRQLDWLLQVQPDYLLCSPTVAAFLAGLLADRGQRVPGLRLVQVMSETLSDETRQRIETGFGVPVKNLYSCTEAGYLASPCPEQDALHVHAENVLLEVLNERDQPCRPGETGRVVLTTLHNFLTPFVRYDLMDWATVGPERCPCGRGLPVLGKILGRQHPLLRLPDGRQAPSRVLALRLMHLNISHQYQIVQRALDHLIIRVVPNRRWLETTAAEMVRSVQECLGTAVRVDVEIVDRVPPSPAGKHRDVVIEVSSEG
jgi:phenylacetate-CoA ligase